MRWDFEQELALELELQLAKAREPAVASPVKTV
jgi:hypothetical protein